MCENFFPNRLRRCNNEREQRMLEREGVIHRNYSEKVVVVGRWERGRKAVLQLALIFIPSTSLLSLSTQMSSWIGIGTGVVWTKKCIARRLYYNMHARGAQKITLLLHTLTLSLLFSLSALSITRTRSHVIFWAYQYLFESCKGDIGRREWVCAGWEQIVSAEKDFVRWKCRRRTCCSEMATIQGIWVNCIIITLFKNYKSKQKF